MMHWKATVVLLAFAVGTLAGCSQPLYLHDSDDFTKRVGVPPDLACNTNAQNQKAWPDISAPSTIRYPEREPWYLTLRAAIAMSLENGTTGLQSVRLFGTLDDDLVQSIALNGQFFGDSIRVLALQPAIFGTNIEANEARYDAVARCVLSAQSKDFPTGSANAFENGQYVNAGVSLEKALPTGGFSQILLGSQTNQGINPASPFYSNFQQQSIFSGVLNPQYQPTLTFAVDQPLLFGFGTDINSLLAQHPDSNLGGAQTTIHGNENAQVGIVIARIQFDEQRMDFERAVNFMLANVETAYWNLYGAFVSLYSSEQALRQAYTAWKINKAKYDAGAIPITQYAQTRGQYEQFRGDRLTALGAVLEAERTLRGLLGLPQEDGKRIVPVDTPTVSQYTPDWDKALDECLNLRPELILTRTDLKQKQLELLREKNGLLPDFHLGANYNINGAGGTLDGDGISGANGLTNNALRSLASDHFNDFTVGFYGSMPLGFRAQNAAVRAAKLRLAQSWLQLRDQEQRAQRYLVAQYRAVIQDYDVIQARHQQREAFADQVEARFKEFVAGKTTADFLLQAQRDWANAVSVEYQAIVEYNNALVRYHFAKGTLLQFDGVQISEGNLPQCVQVRAVENERQRAQAIVVRQEAVGVHEFPSGNPILPEGCAPSLPALLKSTPDINKMDEPTLSHSLPSTVPPQPPPPPSTGPLSSSTMRPIPQATVAPMPPATLAPAPTTGVMQSLPATRLSAPTAVQPQILPPPGFSEGTLTLPPDDGLLLKR
jgi:outer membrane protein TolC